MGVSSECFSVEFDPEDFSLDLCVNCGQVFRWKRIEGEPGAPTRWRGVDGENWFDVTLRQPGLLHVESNGSREAFEQLFRFDWDGRAVRDEMVALGPELQPYIQQLPGLRMMRPSSEVETFFCFLCTPNNHLSRITAMIGILGSYGERCSPWPELTQFPSLQTIAAIPEAELRGRGFGYRGGTLPKAARELVARGGVEYLDSLRVKSYTEAHTELCSISGVGPKLADCIALYGLGHTEAVPIDTHVWQAATRLYFPDWKDTALTHLKYRETGEYFRNRFGKLAGWAHQYLFFDNVLNWRSRKKISSNYESARP